MKITLPPPIAAYFAADAEEGGTIAHLFTTDAVVIDEKRSHAGREAIAKWKAESSSKYDYVSEPFELARDDEQWTVTSRVTGDFPGSPVNLRYLFTLKDDAISRLEITL